MKIWGRMLTTTNFLLRKFSMTIFCTCEEIRKLKLQYFAGTKQCVVKKARQSNTETKIPGQRSADEETRDGEMRDEEVL